MARRIVLQYGISLFLPHLRSLYVAFLSWQAIHLLPILYYIEVINAWMNRLLEVMSICKQKNSLNLPAFVLSKSKIPRL